MLVDLLPCPRCGAAHNGIEAKPLSNPPSPEWSHYATCPATGQPVLAASGPAPRFARETAQFVEERDRCIRGG